MIAQKRLVQVTLDLMCYDDLDVENIDWKDLLELEGDEEVYCRVKESTILFGKDIPFFNVPLL